MIPQWGITWHWHLWSCIINKQWVETLWTNILQWFIYGQWLNMLSVAWIVLTIAPSKSVKLFTFSLWVLFPQTEKVSFLIMLGFILVQMPTHIRKATDVTIYAIWSSILNVFVIQLKSCIAVTKHILDIWHSLYYQLKMWCPLTDDLMVNIRDKCT